MGTELEVSVVISTYNRSALLEGAVESLLCQDADGVGYEVIVVDNNSTDRTRDVVERLASRRGDILRYVFESKQGVSYGRNAGIENAAGPIVAFTDDDVRVSRNWIASIKRAFDSHGNADFVGGRILPHWKTSPPAWLTRDHWWPLALVDFGELVQRSDAANPLCLPTANACFRKEVFSHFGGFSPNFSGREDHEMLLRLWLAGRHGIYVPEIVATAEVQPERMTKSYHRNWNMITGRFNSLMRLNEMMGPDGKLVVEQASASLFGVPAYVYRRLVMESLRCGLATLRGADSLTLQHQNHVWYLLGYIRTRYAQNVGKARPPLAEILRFARSLADKKVNRYRGEAETASLKSDR